MPLTAKTATARGRITPCERRMDGRTIINVSGHPVVSYFRLICLGPIRADFWMRSKNRRLYWYVSILGDLEMWSDYRGHPSWLGSRDLSANPAARSCRITDGVQIPCLDRCNSALYLRPDIPMRLRHKPPLAMATSYRPALRYPFRSSP